MFRTLTILAWRLFAPRLRTLAGLGHDPKSKEDWELRRTQHGHVPRRSLPLTFRAFIGVFLLLVASVGSGQEIVARIMLQDSLGVAGPGRLAAYDTVLNKTFFCGRGGAGVLSGPLGRRTRRIEQDGFQYHSHGMFLHPTLRKLYSVAAYDTVTYVIDADRDTVIGSLVIPRPRLNTTHGYESVCLNWHNNKLYVSYGSSSDYGIAVYDMTADTLLDTIRTAGPLCYNSVNNKLYVMSCNNSVHIYDAETDTFIKTLPAGSGATWLGYLERCNKVYVSNYFGASVTVMDGAGDSVICTIETPGGPMAPVMNETDGKVYVATGAGFVVIDGFGDSVRALIPATYTATIGWNRGTNKVYCNYKGGAKVVDGRTDSLLKDISMPVWASYVNCNTRDNIVYFSSVLTWELLALDGNADTVLWYEHVGRRPWNSTSAWSSRNRRLYTTNEYGRDALEIALDPDIPRRWTAPLPNYADFYPPVFDSAQTKLYAVAAGCETMSVVSCSTMQVLRSIVLPGFPSPCMTVSRHHRLYVQVSDVGGFPDFLAVFDTRTDSLLRCDTLPDTVDIDISGGREAYSPVSDKLYCSAGMDRLLVFSAASGSLLRDMKITRGSAVPVNAMLWHPGTNRLYVTTSEDLKVLDCVTDSVIATIAVPLLHRMCYCPQEDKLYASVDQSLDFLAIDCRTNQVCARLRFGRHPRGMSEPAPVYNPLSNRVYALAQTGGTGQLQPVWWLVAIDCATDRIASWLKIGYEPHTLDVDPDSGYVMAACANSAVYVIRDQVPGLADAEPIRAGKRLELQVRPTPALGGVTVSCRVPRAGRVRLGVHDAAGRLVWTLVDEEIGPGKVEVLWDGTDGQRRLPAGTYFVRLQAGSEKQSRKLVLPR